MVALKRGPLLKMIEAIAAGDRRLKWTHLLQYIDGAVVADHDLDTVKLPFDSPLPTFCIPNDELKAELQYDRKTGDSLLRRAVLGGAPCRVVAALCHLGPEALACPDHRGRVVLHLACLLPASDRTHEVLTLLIKAHAAALLQRDEGGRTPLHHLVWFHAAQRTPEIVASFCTRLPKTKFYGLKQANDGDRKHPLPEIPRPQERIPNSAVIVPDARHGCLPLHYAVANQCTVAVLTVLLQAFPLSKHMTDRYGRTALHWYLGSGHAGATTHVSGEQTNPNEAPWWQRPVEDDVLQLLLSSRVARTKDWQGRHVLHWASHKAALALYHASLRVGTTPTASGDNKQGIPQFMPSDIKTIRSHYTGQIIGKDEISQATPIMVFLDTLQSCQKEHGVIPVEPNMEVLHLLLEHPDESEKHVPAAIEDAKGRLPLHAAVEIGASAEVVNLLVRQHPTALVHTTETYQAPLHAAFTQRAAPLQSTAVLQVLLQTYTAGSTETVVVDGRIALKLEDASGSFPIHYAAENQASLAVLQLLVRTYPPVCWQQRADGNLAIHCLLRPSMIQYLTTPAHTSEDLKSSQGEHPVLANQHTDDDFLLDRRKLQFFFPYIIENEEKLSVAGSVSQMLPLHIAVLFQVVDRYSLLRILRGYPEAARAFTHVPEYSVLDMHELVACRWLSSTDEWNLIRELLFSFVPTLGSHRHRQELLDRCVRIVIDEVNQNGDRPHWRTTKDMDAHRDSAPNLNISHSLSAVEATSRVKLKIRRPPKEGHKKNDSSPIKAKIQPISSKAPRNKNTKALLEVLSRETADSRNALSSVYDEDGTTFDYEIADSSSSDESDDDSSFSREDDEPTDGENGGEDEDDYTDDEGEEIVLGQSTYTDDEEGFQSAESNSLLSGGISASYSGSLSYEASRSFGHDSQTNGSLTLGPSASLDSKMQPFLKRTSRGLVVPLPASLDAFDRAQQAMSHDEEEEKKEKDESEKGTKHKNASNTAKKLPKDERPSYLSDVGMRLWTFFAMYSDDNNPSDNYVEQISAIFDEIHFASVDKLTRLRLPSYASLYLRKDELSSSGVVATFRDIANPKCRELIHKTCYFVGKYDFTSNEEKELLVHRHPSGRSFVVNAFEWHFTTQEQTDALNPGISEATIWKTGEIPAEIGLTFRSHKRPVLIKFTKDPDEYEDEVSARLALREKNAVLPLLSSYNATNTNTRENRTFKTDIKDERFNRLDLDHGNIACLEQFPYALVYAQSTPLVDLYRQRGFDSDQEKKDVCRDVGQALLQLHSCNIVHGGLSLNKIVRYKGGDSSERWLISDCVGSTITEGGTPRGLGRVSQKGHLLTTQMSAPPELMEKATPAQLRHYGKYWSVVHKQLGIKVDKDIMEPYVNPTTGESFIFRYHVEIPETRKVTLPELPYRVLPANTAADMWAFGLLIFELYAGRPLIPYDERSGFILDCSSLAKWNESQAAALIYDYVKNPLAQDLLLVLLGSEHTRLSLNMEDVLKHPLFLPPGTSTAEMNAVIEKRRMDTAAHKRLLQRRLEESSVKEWRESRSVSLVCWDTSVLEKFLFTPTDIVSHIVPSKLDISFPCSHVLLPYRLVRNEDGLLAPERTDDLVKVETLGANILFLSKACRYACLLHDAMRSSSTKKTWSLTSFLSLVTDDHFDDIREDLAGLASKYVESFRDDPMSIVQKLLHERIIDVLSLFADDEATYYIYLVDEFRCLPLSESPIVMRADDDRRSEAILCCLLSMQMTVLYSLHKYSGGQGLLQLFNESATGHIPSSWVDALPPRLRRTLHAQSSLDDITSELVVLQEAFSSLEVSHEKSINHGQKQRHFLHPDGDLRVLRHLVEDRLRDWGDLYRLTVPDGDTGECCLWTHRDVSEVLRRRVNQSTWKVWIEEQHRRMMGTPPPTSPRQKHHHHDHPPSLSQSPRSRSMS